LAREISTDIVMHRMIVFAGGGDDDNGNGPMVNGNGQLCCNVISMLSKQSSLNTHIAVHNGTEMMQRVHTQTLQQDGETREVPLLLLLMLLWRINFTSPSGGGRALETLETMRRWRLRDLMRHRFALDTDTVSQSVSQSQRQPL